MTETLSELLESSGAILRGHFVLTSGRHSDIYFEKFRVLERPDVLTALCQQLAQNLEGLEFDLVVGPTTGGIIIAFEMGRQLGLPCVYVESEAGKKVIRRGAEVPKGARVLVVDDVLTTGLSLREVQELLMESGAQVSAIGVLIDRSGGQVEFGVPLFSSYQVTATTYAPDEVPDWLAVQPAQKPGTRPSNPQT